MTTAEILNSFSNLQALIIGDICLDRWCWYDPQTSEPSRETGIPRIGVVWTEVTPGAGGTIANNLVALGAKRVYVLGVAGEDGFGWELLRSLNARHIRPDLLIRSEEFSTFTYTKLLNIETGEEDRPRVDHINTQPLSPAVEKRILESLHHAMPLSDVILVSDQAETAAGGVVTPAVRATINEYARLHPSQVVWVDSRVRSEHFRHVVLKPNESEAESASTRLLGEVDLQRFYQVCELRSLFVTRGDRGAEVINVTGSTWVNGRSVKAIDVCGAGDSFSAGAACALAVTHDEVKAARIGNLVASITVTKRGTGTASPEEVLAASKEIGE